MTPSRILLAALLIGGCAATPGTGFATLAGGQVGASVGFKKGRLDDQGRWLTSNSHLLALDGGKLTLGLREVALQAPGQAAAGATGPINIDPANPPPGYTFCHNTDCHAADGTVKTFDEIKAELAGAGGTAAPPKTVVSIVTSPAGRDVPLRSQAVWSFEGSCSPHCFLPQGALNQAALGLARLQASGTVVPAAGGEPRAFTLDLPITGSALTATVSAEVTATGPRELRLAGNLSLPDTLFDGIDWERLRAGNGPIDLDADAKAAEAIAGNLAKSTWTAKLETTP